MMQSDFTCLASPPDRLLGSLIICILAKWPKAYRLRLCNHIPFTATESDWGSPKKERDNVLKEATTGGHLGKAQALSFPVILSISSGGEANCLAWEVKYACPRCLETEVG